MPKASQVTEQQSSAEPLPGKSAPRRGRRVAAYFFLACLGLIVGFSGYVLLITEQPQRTSIAIVDTYQPVSLDSIVLTETESEIVPWTTGGQTRVYVNEDFPILRVAPKDPDIENILVFGVDARGTSDIVCRADALIIVTIDRRRSCIKLTSLMRDIQVDLDGRSQPDRLSAAYAYGGVGLLVNTINQTFDLDIQRFAMFDFWSAASLIDALGGVDLPLEEAELPYLNACLAEMNELTGQSAAMLASAGEQHLTGLQAIAWARIRQPDSDEARAGRQRTVIMALIDKYSTATLSGLIAMSNSGLSAFETNLNRLDMLRLAFTAWPAAGQVLELRVPEDGFYTVSLDPWTVIVDYHEQVPSLMEFIYDEG